MTDFNQDLTDPSVPEKKTDEEKSSATAGNPETENSASPAVEKGFIRDVLKDGNPLRIGIASLQELEEMVKSYRIMNKSCLKSRYIMSREELSDQEGHVYLDKGEDIEVRHLKAMRKNESGHFMVKVFLPDEGIVTISDHTEQDGKQLEQRTYHHIMRLGNKAYEGFIDRLGSLNDFLNLFTNALFPKLIIIGLIQTDLLEMERKNLARIKRLDPYLRFLEITHYQLKPFPLIPGVKSIHISEESDKEWNIFLEGVITEYTKPYFVEE